MPYSTFTDIINLLNGRRSENMKPITKRQQAILDFIKEEVDKRGYPPSVREIGLAVGLSSTASVHNQLNQLEKKGLIRKDKSTTRGIVILSPESKQE